MWIEQRIERLVDGRPRNPRTLLTPQTQKGFARLGAPALAGFLALQTAVLIVMLLNPLSCGPGLLLGKMA